MTTTERATDERGAADRLVDVLAAWMYDHDRNEDSPDYPDSPDSAIYRKYVAKRMPDLAANHLSICDTRTHAPNPVSLSAREIALLIHAVTNQVMHEVDCRTCQEYRRLRRRLEDARP